MCAQPTSLSIHPSEKTQVMSNSGPRAEQPFILPPNEFSSPCSECTMCVVAIILALFNYWFGSATGWKPEHTTHRPNKSVSNFLGFVSIFLSRVLPFPDSTFASRLKPSPLFPTAALQSHPQHQWHLHSVWGMLPWQIPPLILTIWSVKGAGNAANTLTSSCTQSLPTRSRFVYASSALRDVEVITHKLLW